jgi:hypothetical protein
MSILYFCESSNITKIVRVDVGGKNEEIAPREQKNFPVILLRYGQQLILKNSTTILLDTLAHKF